MPCSEIEMEFTYTRASVSFVFILPVNKYAKKGLIMEELRIDIYNEILSAYVRYSGDSSF